MGFHHDIRNRNCRCLVQAWSLTILVITLFATFAWADGVKIGSLLTKPELYEMKLIRLTGVVSDDPQIKHIKQAADGIDKCIQFFTVKDATGSIQAAYEVRCSGAMDILRKRDNVTMEARLERTAQGSGRLNVQSVISKTTAYP